MPKPTKGPRLGGSPAHERIIITNLCRELIVNRSIVTTEAKAKRVQPVIEKLITKAKQGTDHARRQVYSKLRSQTAKRSASYVDYTYELFDVIAKEIDPEREGGYTRIVKLPARRGDNTPMAQISIITEKVQKKAVVKDATKTAENAAKEEEAAKEEAAEAKAEEAASEEKVEEAKAEAEAGSTAAEADEK